MESADLSGMLAGIGALVTIVVLLISRLETADALGEKYRFEFTAAAIGRARSTTSTAAWDSRGGSAGPATGSGRSPTFRSSGSRLDPDSPRARLSGRSGFSGTLIVLAGAPPLALTVLIVAYLRSDPRRGHGDSRALLFSFCRLLVAYVISLAWTVPLSSGWGKRPVARIATPIAEVAASIPATAFFP